MSNSENRTPQGPSSVDLEGGHVEDDLLAAYLVGLVDESESADLRAHLSGCELCRQRLDEVQRENDALGPSPSLPWSSPKSARSDLTQKLRRAGGTRPRQPPWLLAAACLVIGFGLGALTFRAGESSSPGNGNGNGAATNVDFLIVPEEPGIQRGGPPDAQRSYPLVEADERADQWRVGLSDPSGGRGSEFRARLLQLQSDRRQLIVKVEDLVPVGELNLISFAFPRRPEPGIYELELRWSLDGKPSERLWRFELRFPAAEPEP